MPPPSADPALRRHTLQWQSFLSFVVLKALLLTLLLRTAVLGCMRQRGEEGVRASVSSYLLLSSLSFHPRVNEVFHDLKHTCMEAQGFPSWSNGNVDDARV